MDILNKTIAAIKPLDEAAMAAARARQADLTKPEGSLGRLEDLSIQLAGIQGKASPVIEKKAMFTLAGDHGVVKEGVGNWPQEVTAQMVMNFLHGGAAINVLCKLAGARIIFADLGVASDLPEDPKLIVKKVGHGTGDICQGPAMTREQAIQAVEAGIGLVNTEAAIGIDIAGTGDMGIGNTTASSAISIPILSQTRR